VGRAAAPSTPCLLLFHFRFRSRPALIMGHETLPRQQWRFRSSRRLFFVVVARRILALPCGSWRCGPFDVLFFGGAGRGPRGSWLLSLSTTTLLRPAQIESCTFPRAGSPKVFARSPGRRTMMAMSLASNGLCDGPHSRGLHRSRSERAAQLCLIHQRQPGLPLFDVFRP